MGRYIAHTRRKIKPRKTGATSVDDAAIQLREQEIAARRDALLAEAERARAAKAARTLLRAVNKRQSVVPHDKSGRRRTAVRAAGIALISATGGLRTQSISIFRIPGSDASDLWGADVKFDIDKGFTYYINDPAAAADFDAIHAMRALAPRIAEQLVMGDALDGPDDNNLRTAYKLAESYMRKSHHTSSLSDNEKYNLTRSIFEEFQTIAATRLKYLQKQLGEIVDTLMQKTKMSKSDCNIALAEIYEGYEKFQRGEREPRRSPPSSVPYAWAPPLGLENRKTASAGTRGA